MLESLFNKVEELKACNFIKKRLQHSYFSVNIAKPLRTLSFTEHSGGCLRLTHIPIETFQDIVRKINIFL